MPDSLSHAFTRIADRAGIAGVTLHGLRHSHASLMLEVGVSMKEVQERLGHSTINVTANIYSHVSTKMERAAVKRFEEAIGETKLL